MFTGCNALLPNEIRPAEALPISPRNPRGANVGYRADQIKDGKLVARGFAFMNISGDELSIKTDVAFKNPTGGVEASLADRIRIWNPTESGYTTYFYYVEEGDGYVWHEENWLDEDEDEEVAKQYQGKIAPWQGFWYQTYKVGSGDEKAMTVSGAVDQDIYDPFQIIDGKLHMFLNPYPIASNIKDEKSIIITNPTGGVEAAEADRIRIWNPDESGYTTYFYYVEDGDGYVWHEENWLDEDEDEEVAKQYQGDIPAGQAFWYQTYLKPGDKAKTDKSIQFVCPFN